MGFALFFLGEYLAMCLPAAPLGQPQRTAKGRHEWFGWAAGARSSLLALLYCPCINCCINLLPAGQLRNLEKALGGAVRLCDRTALILDIFSQRAATREGKLQVHHRRESAGVPLLFWQALY